jgi:hypothetical protein
VKTKSGTLNGIPVKTLIQAEDLIAVSLEIDSESIVGNLEYKALVFGGGTDMNDTGTSFIPVFYGI